MTHPSVDTWDVTVSFPQGCLVDRRAIIAPLDSPLISRRQTLSSTGPNGKNLVRQWALNLRELAPEEYQQLVTILDNSASGCEPVDLTLRGFELSGGASETVQVRVMNDSVRVRAISPVRFQVDLEVEEFLHAP